MRKEALLIAGYRNRSRWWQCDKTGEKRLFEVFTKLHLRFLKKTCRFRQNIVENEIKLCYYETLSLQGRFTKLYMRNPGLFNSVMVFEKTVARKTTFIL